MDKSKHYLTWWVVGLLAMAAIVAWWLLRPAGVPGGFAVSNRHTKAMEVDTASKIAGRIDTILVREGKFVRESEVLAKMDTRVLQEQRLEVIMQTKETQSTAVAAQALLEQRQNKIRAAQSLANQHQVELDSVTKHHMRSRSLTQQGAVSAQQLDGGRVATESARTALESTRAQVSASKTTIGATCTNIIQAQICVEAAQVIERHITADIDDSELKTPCDGCMQYRVAEPGEVLATGGWVLNVADLSDVYTTFSLSTGQAGTLRLDSKARLILDAMPGLRTPAAISPVVSVAQFTSKTVETSDERLKLMFRAKACILPELLQRHLGYVKTGLPSVVWVRVDEELP